MDLMAPIDLYCERTDFSLWSEPVNLCSNGAFLMAAWFAFLRVRTLTPVQAKPLRWLLPNLALIGVGSGLFHSVATRWSQVMDVVPIGLFIGSMLYLWLRDAHGFTRGKGLLTLSVFAIASCLFALGIPGRWVNGSQGYLGVLFFMAWLGFYQRRSTLGGGEFLAATWLFALSLVFRTVDQWVCLFWPLGTHFLWHLINAFVCYLPLRAYIRVRSTMIMTTKLT